MSEMVDASQSLGLGPPELCLSSRHCYVFPETHQPVTQVSVWEQEMLQMCRASFDGAQAFHTQESPTPPYQAAAAEEDV